MTEGDAKSNPKHENSLLEKLDRLGGYLPFMVLFVVVPLTIYLPNQGHFDYAIIAVAPFLLAGLVSLLAVYFVGATKSPVVDVLLKWLFCVGVFLLLNDMITPVGIGKLDGRNIANNINIPIVYAWGQAALLLVCLVAAWFTKWVKIKRIAAVFVSAMLLMQLGTMALNLSPETVWSLKPGTEPVRTCAAPSNPSTKGNVYHIILDGFSSQALLKMMERNELGGLFDGFVFYKKARSNALITNQSVPGIMTGTFWPEKRQDQTIKQWWYETVRDWTQLCESKGVLGKAYDDGFTVTQYIPRMSMWPHEKASRLYVGGQLAKEGGLVPSFADLWLLRLAPVPAKKNLFDKKDKGPFSRLFGVKIHYRSWSYWSVGLSNILLKDEKARPENGQYVFAHLMMPHYPYVVNGQCEYVGSQKLSEENYFGQVNCSLKVVAALFSELKRSGKFDEAMIVVHGDHGEHAMPPINPIERMPRQLLAETSKVMGDYDLAKYMDNRSLALLLIKLPGAATKPLDVDERLVPMVDLEPTICDVMGWPQTSAYGRTLMADYGKDRRVDIFCKMNFNNILDKRESLFHVIYDGKTWKLNRDYPEDMKLPNKQQAD